MTRLPSRMSSASRRYDPSAMMKSALRKSRNVSVTFAPKSTKPRNKAAVKTTPYSPRTHIKIMLTSVDLDDEALLETDEIDDIAVARGLAAEVESLLSPGAQMNPQFHLLWGHSFAKTARDFVGHAPHPASLRSATLPLRGRDWSLSPARRNAGRMV